MGYAIAGTNETAFWVALNYLCLDDNKPSVIIIATSSENPAKYIRKIIKKSGARYGFYSAFLSMYQNIGLAPRWMLSVDRLSEKYHIPVITSDDLSAPANLRLLNIFGIKTLISYCCDHIFKAPLLGSDIRLLNIHPSSLPEYRGVDPLVEQLADGVDRGSLTLHEITDEIDGGPILHVEDFEYSVKSHFLRLLVCSKAASFIVKSYIVGEYKVKYKQALQFKSCYKSFPSRETIKMMRSNGATLMPKVSDIGMVSSILSKEDEL